MRGTSSGTAHNAHAAPKKMRRPCKMCRPPYFLPQMTALARDLCRILQADLVLIGEQKILLRKRKPGYYENEPLPGVAVLSDRVMDLSRGAPRRQLT